MTPIVTTDSKFRDLQYIWQKRIQLSGHETTHLDLKPVYTIAQVSTLVQSITHWYNNLAEPNPLPSLIPAVAYQDW